LNYTGKIIVTNDEGLREDFEWGQLNKLICEEHTHDPNFTLAELRFVAGGVRGPVKGHEAFHCLEGEGELQLWMPQSSTLHHPTTVSRDGDPITVPLRPGTEYYVRQDVQRSVVSSRDQPLFGVATLCHIDRPCHAHAFSHKPSQGNFLHYHGKDKWVAPLRQEFVEAMYLIQGPGSISSADPLNTEVKDYEIEEGSAVYHPLNTLHRQFHPGTNDEPNFWIHAGYYVGAGRPTAGVFDVPEFAYWQRER
jgi:hypothetical protein